MISLPGSAKKIYSQVRDGLDNLFIVHAACEVLCAYMKKYFHSI